MVYMLSGKHLRDSFSFKFFCVLFGSVKRQRWPKLANQHHVFNNAMRPIHPFTKAGGLTCQPFATTLATS